MIDYQCECAWCHQRQPTQLIDGKNCLPVGWVIIADIGGVQLYPPIVCCSEPCAIAWTEVYLMKQTVKR